MSPVKFSPLFLTVVVAAPEMSSDMLAVGGLGAPTAAVGCVCRLSAVINVCNAVSVPACVTNFIFRTVYFDGNSPGQS